MTPGQASYEGYCAKSGGVSLVSGDRLPAWDELSQDIKDAWEAAAASAIGARHNAAADVEYR